MRFYSPAVLTADDVDAALAEVSATLRSAADADWSVPAGPLSWNCRQTADHVGSCLIAYAGQLTVRPVDRYVSFDARADEDASTGRVLEFVDAAGRILAAVLRATPDDVRAYHPYGTSDPAGFAGAGCVELLVHGHDIATGLGVTFEPSPKLCARVLRRMFPDALSGEDPWRTLLWATGRAALPGRDRVGRWRWHGAPLSDEP